MHDVTGIENFLKSAERGKCFIEYLPAENAWNQWLYVY